MVLNALLLSFDVAANDFDTIANVHPIVCCGHLSCTSLFVDTHNQPAALSQLVNNYNTAKNPIGGQHHYSSLEWMSRIQQGCKNNIHAPPSTLLLLLPHRRSPHQLAAAAATAQAVWQQHRHHIVAACSGASVAAAGATISLCHQLQGCYCCTATCRCTNSSITAVSAQAVAAAVAPQCSGLQRGSSSSSWRNDSVALLPLRLLLLPCRRPPCQLCRRCCHFLSSGSSGGNSS